MRGIDRKRMRLSPEGDGAEGEVAAVRNGAQASLRAGRDSVRGQCLAGHPSVESHRVTALIKAASTGGPGV
ncbi:hypothetical protein MFU01_73460 [Myxococcus fulvus]|uniref:Uncharacterized protein n=1 Tax=Myxococcus fulvus TaxID=33 RepID=A0A511TDR4_MYXFU|nr:hypothetical protein MFU01_73460 [Myxococcus fulvus]